MRTDSKSWRELTRIVRQVRSLCARSLAGNPLVERRAPSRIALARIAPEKNRWMWAPISCVWRSV
jgi:hypothetical protein